MLLLPGCWMLECCQPSPSSQLLLFGQDMYGFRFTFYMPVWVASSTSSTPFHSTPVHLSWPTKTLPISSSLLVNHCFRHLPARQLPLLSWWWVLAGGWGAGWRGKHFRIWRTACWLFCFNAALKPANMYIENDCSSPSSSSCPVFPSCPSSFARPRPQLLFKNH